MMKTLGHKVSESHLKEIMKLIDDNGKPISSILNSAAGCDLSHPISLYIFLKVTV